MKFDSCWEICADACVTAVTVAKRSNFYRNYDSGSICQYRGIKVNVHSLHLLNVHSRSDFRISRNFDGIEIAHAPR